jgi:putative DNA primase/helicase
MENIKRLDEMAYVRANQLRMGQIQYTDTTNADRLVKEFGSCIRYNAAWKKWLVWNERYWQVDEGERKIHRYAKEMVRGIYDDALEHSDLKIRMDIEKFATQSENIKRLNACIELASKRDEVKIESDDLDKNHWLLNVENGTYDFETNDFREHRKEDYISKIASVGYDVDAGCLEWKQFLLTIMDYKMELVKFLQTAAGYSMTGNTTEHAMFMLYGSGANGKSTFLNTLMNILGGYATSAPAETFMKQQGDRISNDIARLRGTRFVTTSEVEQGRRLSENLVKDLVGNDKMTARFLYGEFFTFYPTCKIFMATNHKPTITGNDEGMWRRMRLIPFTTRIPDEEQDKTLTEKLLKESSGILNWLIDGTMRWKTEGLKIPDEVKNATEEYRDEMNIIGKFLKECTAVRQGARIGARELFKVYQGWCEENNERACNERFFGSRMKEMKVDQKRLNDGRYWLDIALLAEG